MPNRTMFVVLAMILCAAFAQGMDFRLVGNPEGDPAGSPLAQDVSVAITSPTANELPKPIPVRIMLSNVGDVSATVPRLDVTIRPSGYADNRQNVPVPVGIPLTVTLSTWIVPVSGQETCKAWITDSADANHANDTAVVIVQCGPPGLSGDAGTLPSRSASPLTSSIVHTRCGVNHVGPVNVTLYDIRGRVAARHSLGVKESSLDVSSLSPGVYLLRLEDGYQSLVQKLVVQR